MFLIIDLLKVEKQLDFRAEREGRDKKERDEKKRAFKNLVRQYWSCQSKGLLDRQLRNYRFEKEEAKKQEEKEREEAAKLRSYSNLMTEENMR